MNIRYKNLSLGYIGQKNNDASINSNYYAEFFNQLKNSPNFLSNIHIFPQRIPRAGFFDELYALETQDFKSQFDTLIEMIIHQYKNALEILNKNASVVNARQYLNWSSVLLRYCQFQTIIDHAPNNYTGPSALEIELIKNISKTEILLSNDSPVSIDCSLAIADKFLTKPDVSRREKIMLLNHIIVTFYRHQKESHHQNKVFELCKLLLKHVQELGTDTFISMLYSSIAYRGLAMSPNFGPDMQVFLLDKAEKIARTLQGDTIFEKTVAKDNLYTCLQTMSKWNLFNNNLNKTENYLIEFTQLDSADSTAHSELGLFYLKNEHYKKAAIYFKKAMELGPPGTGMNAYYYAVCLEKLGHEQEAINYLHEAAELDKLAVSPWLDLMNYYTAKHDNEKTKKIATHIYNNISLMEQLDEDETQSVHNLIR